MRVEQGITTGYYEPKATRAGSTNCPDKGFAVDGFVLIKGTVRSAGAAGLGPPLAYPQDPLVAPTASTRRRRIFGLREGYTDRSELLTRPVLGNRRGPGPLDMGPVGLGPGQLPHNTLWIPLPGGGPTPIGSGPSSIKACRARLWAWNS